MVTNTSIKSTYMSWPLQIIIALCLGVVLFGLFAGIYLVSYEVNHRDTIFPGVNMSGVDLSGLTIDEAAQVIHEQLSYPSKGRLLVTDQEQNWLYTPQQVGLNIDPLASAKKAFEVGRSKGLLTSIRNQIQARQNSVSISPVIIYDQRIAYRALQNIANQVNQPVIEASVAVNGTQVQAIPGQIGIQVDIPKSMAMLEQPLLALQDGVVPLVISETNPQIMDAGPAAELAEAILSQPLTLRLPEPGDDAGPWTITPEELAKFLVINKEENGDSAEINIAINKQQLTIYLASLAPKLKVDPVNARFIFNDDTRLLEVIEPATIGRTLNVDASADYINDQLLSGEHDITLLVDLNEPEVTDDRAGDSLGITELVYAETSYFYGSDPERVQNIAAASKRFHGLLIPPGETFSMAEALGNISLENGYAEALIIVGNQTIKGVGGGVCQVSTTLFRTAFFAGFPIVERHPHAYRVGYYEQKRDGSRDTRLAGLDATVFVPIVDLRFTNDTPYWLLMETYMGNYSLTWKFYSTKDGRSVEWQTSGLTNIVEAPEPLYRENPELDKDEIKQVDYEADGAYIRVDRTVYRDGGVHFSDVITTQYRPWQAIFEYGPGTEDIPTP